MKKLLIGAAVNIVIWGSMVVAVFASPITLDWGTQLNVGKCDKVGSPVINVVERVVNTVDSGQGGNYWAFDDLIRQIQVWPQEDGSYCAIVRNEGKFDAQPGQISPGASATLDGDEDGAFEGGYRMTINGTLKTAPDWKTSGFVGTTDYDCDINGTCLGYVNWMEQYFEPGFTYEYNWWGWIYRAGEHGTWVNSSDGNSGDIF